jgi:hypothetical protein
MMEETRDELRRGRRRQAKPQNLGWQQSLRQVADFVEPEIPESAAA